MVVRKNEVAELRRFVGNGEKLTLNGTFASASATRSDFGSTYTGLTPRNIAIGDGATRHALDGVAQVVRRADAIEGGERFRRLDRDADVPGGHVERVHGERDIERIRGASRPTARDSASWRDLPGETLEHGLVHATRGGGAAATSPLPRERVDDRELAARLAGDPLVGVEASERAPRPNVDEPRGIGELRARVSERELLRDGGAPHLEEVRANRDDQLRRA